MIQAKSRGAFLGHANSLCKVFKMGADIRIQSCELRHAEIANHNQSAFPAADTANASVSGGPCVCSNVGALLWLSVWSVASAKAA